MNALRYNPRFIFIDLSKKQGKGEREGEKRASQL